MFQKKILSFTKSGLLNQLKVLDSFKNKSLFFSCFVNGFKHFTNPHKLCTYVFSSNNNTLKSELHSFRQWNSSLHCLIEETFFLLHT